MRQKRDPLARAHKKGYQAAIHGHEKESCPYPGNLLKKEQWIAGWTKGREHLIAGYASEPTQHFEEYY